MSFLISSVILVLFIVCYGIYEEEEAQISQKVRIIQEVKANSNVPGIQMEQNFKLRHLCYSIIKNKETSILRDKLKSGGGACKHMNIKASPHDELEKVLIEWF